LPEIQGQSNFTLPHFSDIDWVFIISMILSFVALIFTYDSICGEKEQGTLRLILAGTVPRYKVLLGKYCAALCTLGIPLCLGLLISLMVVLSSRDVALSAGAWSSVLVIVLLSFLYLSIFVLLGLFVSSRTAHSADSMVILLLLWVGLSILVPSLGRVASEVWSTKLTKVELQRQLDEAAAQIWARVGEFGANAGSMSYDRDDPSNNPPARARLKTALTNARNHILDDYHDRMLAQISAGERITHISPTRVYQRASEAIAGTGISHCVSLRRQILSYQDALRQYVRDEDSKDPDSLHLVFDEMGCALRWRTISHKPVSFDAVPKFEERSPALGESLRTSIRDIGLLVLFNAVLFAGAFLSFLRYDVR
jgi:ABC-type transport system involved in multi-copper enzyme maturation permease subunit